MTDAVQHFESIRFYEGDDAQSTVVGFSEGILNGPDTQTFVNFVKEHHGELRDVPAPLGSLSCRHVEIVPPFASDEIAALAELCVNSEVTFGDGVPCRKVMAVDNRMALPDPSGVQPRGEVVATRW